MSPAQVSLAIAGTRQLNVTVRDAAGAELTGRAMSFASSASTIASVSSTGTVTALAAGQANITVAVEGKTAESAITVQPATPAAVETVTLSPATVTLDAGETTNLSVRVADAANNALTGRAVAWASETPGVATVDATGKVTAVAGGSARISATSDGRKGEAVVQVRRAVATAQITGALDTLEAYDVRELRAVARDAAGEIIPETQFTWTSSNTAVATAPNAVGASDATLTGVDRGTVTATATSPNGRSATATRVVIKYRSITAATMHSCDIASGGIAWCWGLNSPDARLGDSNVGDGNFRPESFRVPGERGFTQLVSFARFTCGLRTDHKADCWGNNSWGTLGDGTNESFSATPVAVAGNNSFVTLSAGADHACGVTTTNAPVCWGATGGRFGNGNTPDSSSPITVAGGHLFTQISSGFGHSCGVTTANDVACWGGNGNGQIGTSSLTLRVPFLLPNLKASEVAASGIGTGADSHSCASSKDRLTVFCWGRNDVGQLGNGRTTAVDAMNPTPSIVVGQKPL
jgi:uncharacterized protein YjdB